jgi:hypothetical protein
MFHYMNVLFPRTQDEIDRLDGLGCLCELYWSELDNFDDAIASGEWVEFLNDVDLKHCFANEDRIGLGDENDQIAFEDKEAQIGSHDDEGQVVLGTGRRNTAYSVIIAIGRSEGIGRRKM